MIARIVRASASLLGTLVLAGCGTSVYEISIETPIKPKLDISAFQRVLVAGFVIGGTEDVDTNLETVRLLRSQLRSKSDLRVVEADVLPLTELASEQVSIAPADAGEQRPDQEPAEEGSLRIRTEKDLEPYEQIFADVAYWKALGEEYQGPLIVTGSVLFAPLQRSGYVTREQEVYDSVGRRRVLPVRTYRERRGYVLRPKFVFIDGRTGATLYSESYREEILYNPQQNTPALSSYFELMDRLLPSFLNTLSTQTVRGTRVLLK